MSLIRARYFLLIFAFTFAGCALGCSNKISIETSPGEMQSSQVANVVLNNSTSKESLSPADLELMMFQKRMRADSVPLEAWEVAYWEHALKMLDPVAIGRLCFHYKKSEPVDLGLRHCLDVVKKAAYLGIWEGWEQWGKHLLWCGKNSGERLEGMYFMARAVSDARNKAKASELLVEIQLAILSKDFETPRNQEFAAYLIANQDGSISLEDARELVKEITSRPAPSLSPSCP